MIRRSTEAVSISAAGGAPVNWPTVWVHDNGNLEHRLNTNEMIMVDES